MSQASDYTIDNSTGANVRSDINTVLGAIATNNSGGSDNGSIQALGFFANTSSSQLQLKNAAGNAFINLRGFDGTLPLPDGTNSAPSLFFDDDTNTGIYSSGADKFNVAAGGFNRMELGGTTIFNEDGRDVDFRIEGDSEANLFYVDAGNNHIGINDSTPSVTLDITGEGGGNGEVNVKRTSGASCFIQAQSATAVFGSNSNHILQLKSNGTTALTIDTSQRLLIGHSSSLSIGSGDSLPLQVSSTNAPVFGGVRFVNSNSGPFLSLAKSRAGSAGSNTIVQINDDLGTILFAGDDGTDLISKGASISAAVDGTPGSNDMPGRLVFNTTADGAASPSERLRIDKNGHMGLGVTPDDGWPSNGDYRAFQLGTGACVFGRGSGDEDRGGLAVNYYATGSGNKFLANGHANLVYLNDGNIDFYTSAQNTSGADADLSLIHVMAIKPDKDVEIKDGNLVIGTSGHGIDFASNTENESGAGSSYGTVLDDYEEGSWTPTFDAPNQSSTTFGLNHQYGYYTKIGNLVHVTCYLQGFADQNVSGGANDGIVITGLPFTVAALPSTSNVRHAASFALGSRYRLEVDDLLVHAFGNDNVAKLLVPSNGNVMDPMTSNQMRARSGTNEVYFAGSYRVHA